MANEAKAKGQDEFRTGAGDALRRDAATAAALQAKREDPAKYTALFATDVCDSNLQAMKMFRDLCQSKIDNDIKNGNDGKKTTIEFRNEASTNWSRGEQGKFGATLTNYRLLTHQGNSKYAKAPYLDAINDRFTRAGAKPDELLDPKSADNKRANQKITFSITVGFSNVKGVELGPDKGGHLMARPKTGDPVLSVIYKDSDPKAPDNLKEGAVVAWVKENPNLGLNSFSTAKRAINAIQEGEGDKTVGALMQSGNKEIAALATGDAQKQYLDVQAGLGYVKEFPGTGKTGVGSGGALNLHAETLVAALDEQIRRSEAGAENAPAANVNPDTGLPSENTKSGNVHISIGHLPGLAIAYTRPAPIEKDRSKFMEKGDTGMSF